MSGAGVLPSWRPGATRDRLLAFLDAAVDLPVRDRVACLDNDGTLWCERPAYVQLQFFVDELRRRVDDDPAVAELPEFAALLGDDAGAVAEIGLPRVALALAGLFEGLTPAQFTTRVQAWFSGAVHPTLGRPLSATVYQPMLELVEELRRRDFTVAVVTGGGTEFVRAVATPLYGVPPELVVGTLVGYVVGTDESGAPEPRRTASVVGVANEGSAKVTTIASQLGRAPILAAGNSAGDREMLEWAAAGPGPRLAILLDHDDAEREFAYASRAVTLDETVGETEPVTAAADRLGWLRVSMADDWSTVFPGAGGARG